MGSDYGRIHRLLKILTLIQSDNTWTAPRLAVECATSERSIYRDLKMLEGAGIPYFFDEQSKGYSVRRDFFMPPVSLTLDESLALVALAEHVGGGEQIPFTKPAGKAIAKIRCSLPSGVQKELGKLDEHVWIKLAASTPSDGITDVYEIMQKALASRRALFCTYDSLAGNGEGSIRPFVFKPYTLFFSQRAWYIIGCHEGRRGVRCLKLNRFSQCTLTAESYEVPKDFSVAKHLGNAWRMIRGAKSYDVELHFDAQFAETLAETHWHDTQQVLWQDDGSIIFQCTVDGLEEIVWWVLSMGPHCLVKAPQELADRVRTLAAEVLAQYSTRPTRTPTESSS